mmetsp:Transcript_11326/g.21343  ORF Transcript_11326/g.21343 Transcript_11326/m.21343 type:complete len:198 (+) Transcript_11326:66-659(+)
MLACSDDVLLLKDRMVTAARQDEALEATQLLVQRGFRTGDDLPVPVKKSFVEASSAKRFQPPERRLVSGQEWAAIRERWSPTERMEEDGLSQIVQPKAEVTVLYRGDPEEPVDEALQLVLGEVRADATMADLVAMATQQLGVSSTGSSNSVEDYFLIDVSAGAAVPFDATLAQVIDRTFDGTSYFVMGRRDVFSEWL